MQAHPSTGGVADDGKAPLALLEQLALQDVDLVKVNGSRLTWSKNIGS